MATSATSAVPGPRELWSSRDPALWSAVRSRYQAAVEAAAAKGKGKAALPDLDRWYMRELPRALVATTGGAGGGAPPGAEPGAGGVPFGRQPHISRAQLEKLVEWKLARGKWRPRLLAFAKEQAAGVVEAASARALAALRAHNATGEADTGSGARTPAGKDKASGGGDRADGGGGGGSGIGDGERRAAAVQVPPGVLRTAAEELTALKGVGPATASALLAAADPRVPFMSDEALATCLAPGRQSDYSLKAFLELAAVLQDKARALSEGLQHEEDEGKQAKEEAEAEGEGHQRQSLEGQSGAAAAAAAAGGDADVGLSLGDGSGMTVWGAADVERCVWVASVLGGARGDSGGAGSGKKVGNGGEGAAAQGQGAKRARR